MSSDNKKAMVFSAYNFSEESSPSGYAVDSRGELGERNYRGYFVDQHDTQWIFQCDISGSLPIRQGENAELRNSGDWDERHEVVELPLPVVLETLQDEYDSFDFGMTLPDVLCQLGFSRLAAELDEKGRIHWNGPPSELMSLAAVETETCELEVLSSYVLKWVESCVYTSGSRTNIRALSSAETVCAVRAAIRELPRTLLKDLKGNE